MLLIATTVFACGGNKKKEKVEEKADAKIETVYHMIDASALENLNAKLNESTLSDVEEVATIYAPKDEEAEGNYSYTVVKEKLDSNKIILTVTQEGLNDDSLFGQKSILTVDSVDGKWQVEEIKELYKCWPERGHQEWSAEFCN